MSVDESCGPALPMRLHGGLSVMVSNRTLAAGVLAGSASHSSSQWDGVIRGKADKIMESGRAWPDCSPDLIISLGVKVALPTL